MKKRKYQRVQELLPQIEQMRAAGKTQREIAAELGLAGEQTVRKLVYRERKKGVMGVPEMKVGQPAKTIQEYRWENERLKMENQLLRDFLRFTERK